MCKYIRFIYTFIFLSFSAIALHSYAEHQPSHTLVFQSDYGLEDGAVPIMHGIARTQAPDLRIHDLTHAIPTFNIWEASYRLKQTIPYWPIGTVFVSAVDPKFGKDIDVVVAKTTAGHYVICSNNGTLSLIDERLGIKEIRLVQEALNRSKEPHHSPSYYSRDVYAYVGARLAAGIISFEDIGPLYKKEIQHFDYQQASVENNVFQGNIPVLEPPYGNVWTNISYQFFQEAGVQHGDVFEVTITHNDKEIYQNFVPFDHTFNSVPEGRALIYINELNYLSLALNLGNFSQAYNVFSGPEWDITIKKID